MATSLMRLFATLASQRSARSAILQARGIRTSTMALNKKDDILDKDALNPTSTEYSKTGGGDSAAAHEQEAFDPSKTSPESQSEAASRQSDSHESTNPLNVSPGNKEAASWDPSGNTEKGSPNEGRSKKPSGGGSPPKGKKI